jgi:hypothetical protein
MSLKSKIEKEARKRAEKQFELFLQNRRRYVTAGKKIDLAKVIDKCEEELKDPTMHGKCLGPQTFKDLIQEAFVETNLNHFIEEEEDDVYKGAMKGLEDK